MLSLETPLRRRWIVWTAILAVALTAFAHAWFVDQHLTFVSSVQRSDHPIHTPLQRVRPGYTADVSMWIRYALALLEGEESPRSHHTSVDNPPHGREVHWNSALTWWIAGCGWTWHKVTGTSLPASVERAAVWANLPLLLGFVVGFSWWAARRAGALAGVLVAVAMIGHRSIYEGFTPAYPDHHGLIAAATLGLLLGVLFMGGGWLRGTSIDQSLSLLPVHGKSARSAAAWAGFWGGFGLWISTASLAVPIAMVALAGLLATLACRRPLIAVGATFSPQVWRTWGRVGALTSLGFYLLEYFPHHLGWRLEANHPLYALAWWAGAELTACLLEFFVTAPDSRASVQRALLHCAAWALPLALSPILFIFWRGAEVFGLLDPFMSRLHTTITEFLPFSERLAVGGVEPFFDLIFIHPLLYVGAVFALLWAARPLRSAVLLTLVPALAIQGLSLVQSRWSASVGSAQVPLLLALLTCAFSAGPSVLRRWILALLALTFFYLLLPIITATSLAQIIVGDIVPKDETADLVYREIAQSIRDSQPAGKIVLFASPNSSLSLGYYGRFQTLGTLYWENGEGLKSAAALNSAPTEEAAANLIRRLGVTHLAIITENNYVTEYASLLHPGLGDAALRRTFGYRLLVNHSVPLWLEPLPYRPPQHLPDSLATFDALLFKVNFAQTPAEVHNRLGALLTLREQADEALAHYAEVARLLPADSTPWLRRGEILLSKKRWAEAAENFDHGIDIGPISDRYKLLTQAAIAFEQCHRYAESIGYYRRALQEHPTNAIAANNLAWRLATAVSDAVVDGPLALRLAEAVSRAEPGNVSYQDTLAAALAANTRFSDAVIASQRACALAEKSGERALLAACRLRLRRYCNGQRWRE